MSGIGWYGDLGNLQVMPTRGPLRFHSGSNQHDLYKGQGEGWKSPFRHESETASAGYYSVTLDKHDIDVDMTATARTGMLRMSFPTAEDACVQIDLARRVGGRARHQSIQVIDDHTIQGSMRYEGDGQGFSSRTRYTFHFYAEFDQAWDSFGLWNKGQDLGPLQIADNNDLGFYARFKTTETEPILMKVGISFVSIANARANLEAELVHWDFDRVRREAKALWAKALKGVDIEGGTEKQKEIFATALYHCSIDPRIFVDTNGEFFGADYKVHRSDQFNYRTIFSGWDVFRSQFPLQTLINPAMVNDEINSLIHLAEYDAQRQAFPRWELLSTHTGCMLGNPAISVIADAYTKGIRDYDVEKAFGMCVATAEKYRNPSNGYTPGDISRTLEYAYTDWCVAELAEQLNKPKDAETYGQRALTYKTIWDPNVAWFHSRNADGSWTPWKGKTVHGQGCTESNPFQQGWFVPHDVYGLMDLMGKDTFLKELTTFFDRVPKDFLWNDYYNHANEPCHHVVFLFNYAGAPWLTQKWSRAICDVAYNTGVKGLCGNEDVGQMSAWYVLAAMGLHPVCPGDGIYQLTSPVFDRVSIRLDPRFYKGGTFTVSARNNSKDNVYIQSAKLHGQPLNRAWITHEEIVRGGTLEFVMGPTPNKAWASAPEDLPPSPVKR
jgi:predicted alpha-1,2-mannosidase